MAALARVQGAEAAVEQREQVVKEAVKEAAQAAASAGMQYEPPTNVNVDLRGIQMVSPLQSWSANM